MSEPASAAQFVPVSAFDLVVFGAAGDAREPAVRDLAEERRGSGRELFAGFRSLVGGAEDGAMTFGLE